MMDINNPGQVVGRSVTKSKLITDGTFCWLLIEVLTIEWVPPLIRLTMCDIPPVVPVVNTEGLSTLNLGNLRINERLGLVKGTTCVDLIVADVSLFLQLSQVSLVLHRPILLSVVVPTHLELAK